ncbi:hypothetical protein G5714_009707 [Onychostoma macrolepis]|uniref:HECT domain-containing protein n=1 Tax=Onychostoma macrolepis TaxID=369639 RepID=A0A7J6CV83_9TELE|nr:hypothetical protein G5714_009707 [Onychostoma macrolepis]
MDRGGSTHLSLPEPGRDGELETQEGRGVTRNTGARRKESVIPKVPEKFQLERAGLGEKKIIFSDRYCSSLEFSQELMRQFPKLSEAGGFQLLKRQGCTRTKILEPIPCPDEGYTPEYLCSDAVRIGAATIYIRPLQKDLNTEVAVRQASGNGPPVVCLYCSKAFPLPEIQEHVDCCELNRTNSPQQENSNMQQQFTCSSTPANSPNTLHYESSSRAGCSNSIPILESSREGSILSGREQEHQETSGFEICAEVEDWKIETDEQQAAYRFRRNLLYSAEDRTPLKDEDEDVHEVPLELKCQMSSYLRKYIENATALDLEQLVTFWVGWAILPEHLYVEVTDSVKMPTAFTCSENIKLPSHYTNFMDFEADLKAAVSTFESGFGLV